MPDDCCARCGAPLTAEYIGGVLVALRCKTCQEVIRGFWFHLGTTTKVKLEWCECEALGDPIVEAL